MIKAILFDCDGVLINSEVYYLTQTVAWMNEAGYNVDEATIFPIIGTSMKRTCEILAQIAHSDPDTILKMNDDYFSKHPLPFKDIIKDGVMDTLHALSLKGIRMAICSASPRKDLDEIMRQTGFSRYIEYVISGDELTESKPSGQIYLHAADKLGVTPHQCLVIEDSSIGIQAGKNAGMRVIALHDPRIPVDQSMADVIINHFGDILEYIKD